MGPLVHSLFDFQFMYSEGQQLPGIRVCDTGNEFHVQVYTASFLCVKAGYLLGCNSIRNHVLMSHSTSLVISDG